MGQEIHFSDPNLILGHILCHSDSSSKKEIHVCISHCYVDIRATES